ncbi:DUF3144 domain-containing protein [Thiolinea disciformis]|uniref:DUF3144 domain-containing protein n=1 Tax=Thiolinea disciformis TaxID=125614 RepID=UPI000378B80D|nr:DUF3144 domain-containing protein [Thiolinea disciformis]
MSEEIDESFYTRADAHIELSNQQIHENTDGEKVSLSMMYAAARFNAWLSATGYNSAQELKKAKAEQMKYFMGEYRQMLEENFDDYIENFQHYMMPSEEA